MRTFNHHILAPTNKRNAHTMNKPKTVAQQVKEFGAKVTKITRGMYTYHGKNFTVDFENTCEIDGNPWEVSLVSRKLPAALEDYLYDGNYFETKGDLVFLLLGVDQDWDKVIEQHAV